MRGGTQMLSIGDFSRLSRIPVKTLRYYDEIGLFKPLDVDRFTGYRHYSANQLPQLNRILALKDLGLSLEQIAQVLHENLSLEQLRGMLRLRQAEIQQRMVQEQAQLTRVEARLKLIEMENSMPDYDVIVKNVDPQLVASLRDTLPSYQHVGQLFEELYTYLQRYGADGLGVAIWHDEGYKASDVDGEAVAYLKEPVPEGKRIKVYELPATQMASVIHHGSYNTFNKAYHAALKWIEVNGYEVVGPNREVYLYNTSPVQQDDPSYVTEIQFPVAKI
jgi:effector-binding domain-containing protein